MLRVKVLLFLQDDKFDGTGFREDIYNRKIESMIVTYPIDIAEHGAETVLLRRIKETLERLYENIEATLKIESKYDLDYICEKNAQPMLWDEKE